MLFLKNFILALGRVLDIGIDIMIFLIFIRAIISWVNPDPRNPIVHFLHNITEPLLYPIRRLLMRYGPRLIFDLSPMIVILLLIFIQSFLIKSLLQLAYNL